jgi:hypothetical protein
VEKLAKKWRRKEVTGSDRTLASEGTTRPILFLRDRTQGDKDDQMLAEHCSAFGPTDMVVRNKEKEKWTHQRVWS